MTQNTIILGDFNIDDGRRYDVRKKWAQVWAWSSNGSKTPVLKLITPRPKSVFFIEIKIIISEVNVDGVLVKTKESMNVLGVEFDSKLQ